MTTLYLDRKGLEVKVDGRALALYENGRRAGTVPINLLSRVVIRAETRLTSSVLGALGAAGCSTLILSGRHGKRMATIHGRPHNDALLRIGQYAAIWDSTWRLEWAKRFVGAKLSRQIRLMEHVLAERRDLRKPVMDTLRTLRSIRVGVPGVSSIASLRGSEGAAQAAYFRAYANLVPPSLGFKNRNRRPPRDPVNACLSLGYTLVHFEGVRVAYAAGLDPFLGFLHEIAFGRESLACDLIEPIRPLVDGWVWEIFRSRILRPEHFTRDKGACLLRKTGRARYYEHFEEFLQSATTRLRGYCRLLVKALRLKAPELLSAVEEGTQ